MRNFFRFWGLVPHAYLIFNMAVIFGSVTGNKSCVLSVSISVTSESITIQLMSPEMCLADLDINGLWIVAADGSKTYFTVSKLWMTERTLTEILQEKSVCHFNDWGNKLKSKQQEEYETAPQQKLSQPPDGLKWIWPFQAKTIRLSHSPQHRGFSGWVLGCQDMRGRELSEVTHCGEGQCQTEPESMRVMRNLLSIPRWMPSQEGQSLMINKRKHPDWEPDCSWGRLWRNEEKQGQVLGRGI